MRSALIGLTLLFLASCATTMPGQKLSTGNTKITATIAQNSNFSNERIQMYQFSLKNNSDVWVELEGATLLAGKNVSVLVGDRISSWTEACTLEKNVSDYNTALVLGSLAIGGAVVAGSSNHSQTANTGAVIALGSISAMAVRDYQNSKNKIEFQRAFPDKHIFQPVVIPPQKVIQRWILIENPSGESFKLNLKNKAGDKIELSVRGANAEPEAEVPAGPVTITPYKTKDGWE